MLRIFDSKLMMLASFKTESLVDLLIVLSRLNSKLFFLLWSSCSLLMDSTICVMFGFLSVNRFSQ